MKINEKIKGQQEIVRIEKAKLTELVYKEEDSKLKPLAKTYLGKCYRYRNSYGTGTGWWLYRKIKKVVGTKLILVGFQKTSMGKIEIDTDDIKFVWNNENAMEGYTEITNEEFKEQRKQILIEIKKVFDDYEYDDEDFIITPHLELLQNKLKNKIK